MFTERLKMAVLVLAMIAVGCTAALSVEMEDNNRAEPSSGTPASQEEGTSDPPEENDKIPPQWRTSMPSIRVRRAPGGITKARNPEKWGVQIQDEDIAAFFKAKTAG